MNLETSLSAAIRRYACAFFRLETLSNNFSQQHNHRFLSVCLQLLTEKATNSHLIYIKILSVFPIAPLQTHKVVQVDNKNISSLFSASAYTPGIEASKIFHCNAPLSPIRAAFFPETRVWRPNFKRPLARYSPTQTLTQTKRTRPTLAPSDKR